MPTDMEVCIRFIKSPISIVGLQGSNIQLFNIRRVELQQMFKILLDSNDSPFPIIFQLPHCTLAYEVLIELLVPYLSIIISSGMDENEQRFKHYFWILAKKFSEIKFWTRTTYPVFLVNRKPRKNDFPMSMCKSAGQNVQRQYLSAPKDTDNRCLCKRKSSWTGKVQI